MNQKEIIPAQTSDPIEIGTRGYTLGAKFYLGLQYKRVQGKNRVRGIRKDHYTEALLGQYSPSEWQNMTPQQRKKPFVGL